MKTGDPCEFGRGLCNFQFAHLGPLAAAALSPNFSPCLFPLAWLLHRSPLAVLLRKQRILLVRDWRFGERMFYCNRQKVFPPFWLRLPPLPLRLVAGRALLASRSPFFSRFSLFSLLSDGASFTKGFFFPTVSQEVLKIEGKEGEWRQKYGNTRLNYLGLHIN